MTEAIWVAVVIAIPATISAGVAWFAARKAGKAARVIEDMAPAIIATQDGVFEVGQRIDGRLSELLETTRALSRAEGKAEGEQAQRDVERDRRAE
jgi:hypothetical protein